MTYTYKLARRIALLRTSPALALVALAACTAADPTGVASGDEASSSRPAVSQAVTTLADSVPSDLLGSIVLSPGGFTVQGGSTQQFRVSAKLTDGTLLPVAASYVATGGAVTAAGLYTAGYTAGNFKVIASFQGKVDTTPLTVTMWATSISLTPAVDTLAPGATQQFSASGTFTDGSSKAVSPSYTATGGTITSGGLYTAGAVEGSFQVIASLKGKADTSVVTIKQPPTLAAIVLSPASVSLSPSQTQQFSVSGKMSDGSTTTVTPTFTATGGTITGGGLYTAGATSGSYAVIATVSGKADTSAITIAAPPPPPPSGSVLWNATIESGAFPSGTALVQCAAGRIKPFTASSKPYSTSPTPRSGLWAVKFETLDTDYHCGGTSESRSQAESPRVMKNGSEYWLSESVYFPADFPSIDRYYFMFTELYSPVGGGQPAVAFYLTNGTNPTINFNAAYNAATMSNHNVAQLSRPKGQWIDLLIHIKISTTPSVGFVELWRDGVNVPLAGGVTTNGVSRLVCQTMLDGHASGGMSMMLNDYRSYSNKTSTGTTVLYFDEAKIGTSRAAVDPRASGSALLALQ